MSRDFTFEAYAELLDVVRRSGYETLTVREYIERRAGGTDGDPALPERFVIFRHDVDRKPDNSLRMARLEAAHDVTSTYYVRTVSGVFHPELVRRIARLGHEVGYHYEDMDRAEGDPVAARRSFGDHLSRVRDVADVHTVCMHGNPLTPYDNRDMWGSDPDFAAFDLLGEAYLSMDFTDVTYFSDTGRTWRDGPLKVKDHTMGTGQKAVTASTTGDLVDLFASGSVRRACLLVHPDRWSDTLPELLANAVRDGAVNVVKRGLKLRERQRGPLAATVHAAEAGATGPPRTGAVDDERPLVAEPGADGRGRAVGRTGRDSRSPLDGTDDTGHSHRGRPSNATNGASAGHEADAGGEDR